MAKIALVKVDMRETMLDAVFARSREIAGSTR